MKKSALRQAVKVVGSALIGAILAPTATLAAQWVQDGRNMLGEWLLAPEHHGEPRHTMGGLHQPGTGTTPMSLTSVWTADLATPMAEVLLLNDSLKAMAQHNRIVLDRSALTMAGLVLQRIIKDRPPRV